MKKPFIQVSLTLLGLVLAPALHAAVIIDFDTFPDSSIVPNGTIITTQYLPLGVTFSSVVGGPVAGFLSGEAASLPNFLFGNPDSLQSMWMDFTTTQPSVGVTLISVGDGIVTATAYAADLTTVLDAVSVTHPGTGVGFNNKDPITLNGPSIARVAFTIVQTGTPLDGFGIDDVAIVPEPSSAVLGLETLGIIAGILAYSRRRRTKAA